MSSLLLLLLVIAALVLGCVGTLAVQRVLRDHQKTGTQTESDQPDWSPRMERATNFTPSRPREFEGDPFPEPGRVRAANFAGDTAAKSANPFRGARDVRSDGATYRAARGNSMRPGSQWNPFAEDQSRASRIKAARHRPRAVSNAPDYYALLGIERSATDAQIEQAYRRHAALIHPDRFYDNPVRRKEAEAKLKQLNAVMQVLRDPLRRARYDSNLS